ncbi:HAMP domain-containing histidine kinase [bacterium]|nr:HAMP domain-containing histidine kinase [bacterium]
MNSSRATLFWVLCFILALALIATLATSWNIVLVSQYQRMIEMGQALNPQAQPWVKVVLGTSGFAVVLVLLVGFFLRSQREMRTNTIQREFLAKLSHELKSPLSTLELTGALLKKEDTNAEDRHRLWKAHDAELKRLKNEVNLLLESARWDSGIAKPTLKELNLEDFLQEILQHWKQAIGLDHSIDRSGDRLELKTQLDSKLLALIMNNLIDNARKFSPRGTEVRIHTQLNKTLKKSTPSWSIQVIDQGSGIKNTERKKVFERFYSQKSTSGAKASGTGLGLYLAQRAARAMKLQLNVKPSSESKGSAFVLSN